MNGEKDSGLTGKAEEVAEIAEKKMSLREHAKGLNIIATNGESITEEMVEVAEGRIERVAELRKSPEGKFRVIGVDKFSNEDWLADEFNTPEEALEFAREKSEEASPLASSSEIATVYYAYDPEGNYLGGDVLNEE